MQKKLFGTDGIRGVANEYPMTSEIALALGRAVSHIFHTPRHQSRVLIGKDTRLSGYMLEYALASGICSTGSDVLLCGVLPTPGIAFITQEIRANAGVVISASHNTFKDNGIKIFGSDGYKLSDDLEHTLEDIVLNSTIEDIRPTSQEIGRALRIDGALGRYIVYLKRSFPKELSLKDLKIVVDCANGAAYRVAPEVFWELGAEVVPIGIRPDGTNINKTCGATHPEALRETVLEQGANIGIALDGDADRVILCDEKGTIVDGDHIMAICATRMVSKNQLHEKTLVATVMSNLGLQKVMDRLGGTLLRTDVGDRYVTEKMRSGSYDLGGEQSGHIIFSQHSTTGDGILTSLQVLAVMVEENKPLSELATIMEQYPQILLNVRVKTKPPLIEIGSIRKVAQRVEEALGSEGRLLLRYSGTEPKARIMIEGGDQECIAAYANEIADAIRETIGE